MAQTLSSKLADSLNSTVFQSAEDFAGGRYDYLIIGGGTAGLVIAARLTENANVTVGVIEAGKNKLGDTQVEIPGLLLSMLNDPEYDWCYKTLPQAGNNNKCHHMPRGKVLGGSSATNYMMYVRGSDQDYDDWAVLSGDNSWSSENMKQYMRKHQTLEPLSELVTDRSAMPFVGENHGTSGPVRTSFNERRLAIEDKVIQAVDEVTGLTKKPIDPWGGDHIGFYHTLGAVARTGVNKGLRSYAAKGYLQSNQQRSNLKVLCESLVSRIVLEGNCAKGIQYIHKGKTYAVMAEREVIVCGGTINSPQILELSGIGDPKVLQAAGIECRVNLPSVGNDLQDHVICGGVYKLAPGTKSSDSIYDPISMAAAQKEFQEQRSGPLTNISSVQGYFPVSWFLEDGELEEIIKLIESSEGSEFHRRQRQLVIENLKSSKSANLQFCLVPFTSNCTEGAEDQTKFFPPPGPGELDGITIGICLQYPVSRGQVHVQSSDPYQSPKINPNYLNHAADVAVVAAGMKLFDKMKDTAPLRDDLSHRHYPEPETDLSTVEGRRFAVKEFNMGQYHPCGSCAMGSTVDSRLKVKGVKRLRVADASIFPNHVSGNIVSSVYAMAERAADIIKEDWDFNLHVGTLQANL